MRLSIWKLVRGLAPPLAAGALLMAPSVAAAAEIREGNSVTVPADETINDDLYAFGQSITVLGTVNGDVVAAGQSVTIKGAVHGSVLAAGSTVDVSGTVDRTVRVAGSSVTVDAPVGGDLLVGAGSLNVADNAPIGRDLLGGVASANVASPVGRNVLFSGGTLVLGNQVGGDVRANAEHLQLGPDANIHGSLAYTSANEAQVAPSARIGGAVDHSVPPQSNQGAVAEAGAGVTGWIKLLVGLVASGLLLVLLFPRFTRNAAWRMQASPWPSLGLGFALLVVTPIAAVLLFGLGLVVGGWWLGPLLLAVYAMAAILGYVTAATTGGAWAFSRLRRPHWHLAWGLILGLVVLGLVGLIPVLGGLVLFIATIWGLGALILTLVRTYRGGAAPAQDVGSPPASPTPVPQSTPLAA